MESWGFGATMMLDVVTRQSNTLPGTAHYGIGGCDCDGRFAVMWCLLYHAIRVPV